MESIWTWLGLINKIKLHLTDDPYYFAFSPPSSKVLRRPYMHFHKHLTRNAVAHTIKPPLQFIHAVHVQNTKTLAFTVILQNSVVS